MTGETGSSPCRRGAPGRDGRAQDSDLRQGACCPVGDRLAAQSHSQSPRLQQTLGSNLNSKSVYDGLIEGLLTIYRNADNSSEDCFSMSLKCLTGCCPAGKFGLKISMDNFNM